MWTLGPDDIIEIDGVKYIDKDRCSGLCVCEACGKLYYDHPMFRGILSYDGHPFLTLICGNILVKL